MRFLSLSLLSLVLVLGLVPSALAHDVTLTGTTSFTALDGSSTDHDGTANGVFTVSDGNLVVNGIVNCNDDSGANDSACAMAFSVSGNMSVNQGGALYAENRSGSGTGGAITLTVGGALALSGNAVVSSASKSSSGSGGGQLTANVGGTVTLASGTTIDSGSSNAAGGAILIAAGGSVSVDGNIYSGPSRTLLGTRLSGGAALDGGTANSAGGAITIGSSTFAEPSVVVGSSANIVSQGADNGAGPVTIDGCGIQIYGLVAALSRKNGVAKVSIRSGKDIIIDGRDLGGSGTRMGRVRADAPTGTAANKGVDIFAVETVELFGPATGLFVLTALPGLHDAKSFGGLIRITSLGDSVKATGNAIDDGHSASGDTGGTVEISARADVRLDTAVIRAVGDFNTNNANRGGGKIRVRSYSGDVSWTNGTGEVRPVGSTSNLALADQGSIILTACGTVDTTGSSFPLMGTATSMFPETHTGVCSPAAPSLPAGVPPLVTCNTPPVANDASASTNEDTTVTVALTGTDADGDSLMFTIVSGPANGALGPVISTGPASATVDYTPNLNYNGGDAFLFRANDGNGGTDDATATITITPVNDPPSFLAGPTAAVLEDSGAQTYTNWVTAISAGPGEAGQTVTFSVTNDNNALFAVQPVVDASGTLTFTPAANQFGSATITIVAQDNGGTANGGDDTSNAQTSSINVNGVNDEPSFSSGGNVTVNEDSGTYSASWATGISPGSSETQTVTFNVSSNNNALFSLQPSISASGILSFATAANANGSAVVTVFLTDDGGTANGGDDTSSSQTFSITVNTVNDPPSFTSGGTVSVNEDSGSHSAAWATAISAGPADENGQTLAFTVSNDNNTLFSVQPAISPGGVLTFTLAASAFGSATVAVSLSDNGGIANGGVDTSASQLFTINVNSVNDEPSFTGGGNVSVNEDSGAYSAAWATGISAGSNESGQTLTFFVSNDNNALFASQPSISASGVLTFTPAANASGIATVSVYLMDDGGTANGGDDTSPAQTFDIAVNAVNDEPVFTSGGNVSVFEDSGPYSAAWATGISAGPNEGGQSVAFSVSNNNNALFSVRPALSPLGVLTFTVAPNTFGSATVSVFLADDGGTANGGDDTSGTQTFTITVDPVNDAPSFAGGGDVTVNEDSGPYAAAWATGISSGPNESGQIVSFNVSNSSNGLFLTQPAISSSGLLSFTPAPNASGAATVTVTLSDNGGTANGGADTSAAQAFVINITAVNDGPTAAADSWETLGNTELRVDLAGSPTPAVSDITPSGNGVRHNDTDPEGDPMVVTGIVGCGDVTVPFDCTVGGAKISMLANGSFSYTPAPGAISGTFQYTVTDLPSSGSPATSTGTVNIAIFDMIWYVNGAAAPGGDGTSNSPFSNFSSLDGASDADAPGHTIFVHNSAVAGSLGLEANEKLWGEGIGLIKPNNLNGNGSPIVLVAPGNAPVVTSVSDVVTVNAVTGVEIAGLTLNSGAGNAIDITSTPFSSAAGATIYDNFVSGAGAAGIEVNAGSSAANVVTINNTSIVSTGNGLDANTVGTLVISFSNGTITSSTGSGIVIVRASGSLTIKGLSNVIVDGATAADGIRVNGATFDAVPGGSFDPVTGGAITVGSSADAVGGAAVTLVSVSGAVAFGTLDAHGSTTGVTIAGTGLFTGSAGMQVTSGGGTVRAAEGHGLSVTNTTIGSANLAFTSVSSNGGVNGIVLNNTGSAGGLKVSGTGAANSGGTIQSTTSHGVALTSTFSPSFNNLKVQNSAGSGVKGSQVTDFSFTNGSIDNSGTGGGANESNIAFNATSTGTESNLSGTVTITGNSLTNALWHGIDVANFSGTLANVDASNNVITSGTSTTVSKGSGIRVLIFGSASTVSHLTRGTFANNTINNFPSGSGIQVHGGNSNAAGSAGTVGVAGSATDVVAITGNRIRGLSPAVRLGTGAIVASVSGRGQGNFDISGNGTAADPLTNMTGSGISVGANGFATATVVTSNNVIVANNGLASAGISGGTGAVFSSADTPGLTWTITGNSISNTDGNGILAVARGATGFLKLKVQNNVVAAPLTGVRQGIRIDAGNSASINDSVCINISGNISAGSGGTTGIGMRKQGISTTMNAFGIHSLSPSPAGSPAVETNINSQNPAGNGTLLLSATNGFTACSFP